MAPLPPAAAHAFVADLDAPVLGAADHHHLARALRLRDGQAVTVADGGGRWRLCTWRDGGALEPAGPVEEERPSRPPVTVAFALTKGERPEWVVQKLTEIGVDTIAAFRADRSVVRWDDDRARDHAERWRKVAREAAMQSRRARLPEVAEVTSFADVVRSVGVAGAMAAPGGGPPSLARPALLVGPEGGWAPGELACGLPVVGLGPTVLRSETAALSAAVVLCALREGTFGEVPPARAQGHIS